MSQKYPSNCQEKKGEPETRHNDFTVTNEIAENGVGAVPELMRVLINSITQTEWSKDPQAGEYEQTEERKGHASGYKPKTVRT